MPLKENKKACLFFTRKDSLLENTKNQLLDAALENIFVRRVLLDLLFATSVTKLALT